MKSILEGQTHPRWYRITSIILMIGGIAKIFSAIYLQLAETGMNVFLFKPGVLIGVGIYEFLVASMMTSTRIPALPKLIIGFWTGTAFLAAHLFFYFLKIGGCPCLGIFAMSSGVLSRLLNVLIVFAALYIFIGSFQHFRREIRS
ncbi:hypothetical protein N9B57_00845 [Verrucomicrobia bacterium]|jgi:hypothetical protein|nr:hypothetical protein [Verrucomicrobiota bacterium]MDA7866459.1 hypothetical protein [Verrucomicrobiota bacterium]